MRDSEFRDRRVNRNPSGGNLLVGLLVLGVGFVLLMRQLDFVFFPSWLFTWPMLLILLGLFIGAKKQFTGVGWAVLILIGLFLMMNDITVFHWHLRHFALPVVIILAGLFLMFRSLISPTRSSYYKDDFRNRGTDTPGKEGTEEKKRTMRGDDFVDNTNVFGSSKKKIFSKSFVGADITNFFGGTELDLTQADVEHTAVIDVVQVFGGVKLVIPANWSVRSDVASIFGGINDKRSTPASLDNPDKMLVISGVCIFGGIEIKSY